VKLSNFSIAKPDDGGFLQGSMPGSDKVIVQKSDKKL
jgi:hypothetical protein